MPVHPETAALSTGDGRNFRLLQRCHGFGMFSFQPAAFVGDDRRRHEDYRDTSADEVTNQRIKHPAAEPVAIRDV